MRAQQYLFTVVKSPHKQQSGPWFCFKRYWAIFIDKRWEKNGRILFYILSHNSYCHFARCSPVFHLTCKQPFCLTRAGPAGQGSRWAARPQHPTTLRCGPAGPWSSVAQCLSSVVRDTKHHLRLNKAALVLHFHTYIRKRTFLLLFVCFFTLL